MKEKEKKQEELRWFPADEETDCLKEPGLEQVAETGLGTELEQVSETGMETGLEQVI